MEDRELLELLRAIEKLCGTDELTKAYERLHEKKEGDDEPPDD